MGGLSSSMKWCRSAPAKISLGRSWRLKDWYRPVHSTVGSDWTWCARHYDYRRELRGGEHRWMIWPIYRLHKISDYGFDLPDSAIAWSHKGAKLLSWEFGRKELEFWIASSSLRVWAWSGDELTGFFWWYCEVVQRTTGHESISYWLCNSAKTKDSKMSSSFTRLRSVNPLF